MDTQTDAVPPGGANDIVQIPAPVSAVLSAREAARTLAGFRLKHRDPQAPEAGNEPAANSAANSGSEPDAPAAAERAEAGEPPDQASPEPAALDPASPEPAPPEKAPLEPPPSWKEARERWAKLDPQTQDFLRQRESEDSATLRQAQSEAAAERQRMEQARQHYESALPEVLAVLQQEQAASFSDIKPIGDVEKLAREDWPRYVLWDSQQKRLAAVQDQLAAASERQSSERRLDHEQFIQREFDRFVEKAPEFADPAQRAKLQGAAVGMLHELGFSDSELAELWQGRKDLSLHDHRLHLLIRDGLRFRDARAAARAASAKPVPPV
jgi:hypothetical protein